jgi:hypothetical protein
LEDRVALAGPAVWGELVGQVGPAALVASVALAELEGLEESVVRVAGTAFRRFRPVAGTEATGSISRSIVAALPIATGLQRIVSAEPRAAIRLLIVGIARGNSSVARAVIWEAIVQEVVLA